MIRYICHQLIKWLSRKNYFEFKKALKHPKFVQLEKLYLLTGIKNYDVFKNNFPITEYAQWKNWVDDLQKNRPEDHYVPTSGSTHEIKWVPYTAKFKEEMWRASSPWLYDLYERYPKLKQGTHYWSLSWLPEELRAKHGNNDLEFFEGFEKILLSKTMTLNDEVSHLKTLQDSMRESVVSLIEKKPTLISVWSPTFLLEVLEMLVKDKEYFLLKITNKEKREALEKASCLTPELLKVLFPELVLISAWATSTSKVYADQLKDLFPQVNFEAKGLWATEGVVTIPFEGKFPLAINSHFYEFIEEETGKVFPSWELKKGMRVIPLLTTGAGFFRYRLNDLLLVSEYYESTPCFEFLGRLNETDLVGEKISSMVAVKLIEEVKNEFREKLACLPISLLAIQGKKPHYALLVDGMEAKESEDLIAQFLEKRLRNHFHYTLARDLNQLSEVKVIIKKEAYLEYVRYREKSIALRGNIKIEPLLLVRE